MGNSSGDRVADLRERLHILEGLAAAQSRWSEVSALVYETESADSLRVDLVALLGVDPLQAAAISDMQVRRLGQLERERLAQTLAYLKDALSVAEN